MKLLFPSLVSLGLAIAGTAFAQAGHEGHHGQASAKAAAGMAEGEVRNIDKEAGRVTLKHGPIASIGMPPMTMVYQVRDRTLLDKVKEGDRVRFQAENKSGAYQVIALEAAR